MSAPADALHRRAAEIRARALVREWRFRQRGHASGVWDRLRRVLVDADRAFAVPAEVMDRLVSEGLVPHPVGLELSPTKRLVFLPDAAAAGALEGAHPLPVRLTAPFLAARDVVLVPFPDAP